MGATFVPLNYRAKVHELAYMVTAANVSVLLVGDRYLEVVRPLHARFPSVQHYVALESLQPDMPAYEELITKGRAEVNDVEVEESDVSILMYTSGTTALPKGVMLTYGDFTEYVVGTGRDGGRLATWRIALVCAALSHCWRRLHDDRHWAGRKIVVLRQFDPTEWLTAVQNEQVSHAFVVPTMLKQLIDHPDFSRFDLSSLKNLAYGAAPMPFPVIRRAIEMFPAPQGS